MLDKTSHSDTKAVLSFPTLRCKGIYNAKIKSLNAEFSEVV
jgi:hypothetical protein